MTYTAAHDGYPRRALIRTAGGVVAVSAFAAASGAPAAAAPRQEGQTMGTITMRDGAAIFYKDWGEGPVVMLSHGWPLSADTWEDQLFVLASNGFRAIAHDRRGHGRSSQTWNGNDMDTYADDVASIVEALDLRDVTHVGHSSGGGEVARYIGRHGTTRVKRVVLVSSITPTLLKTPSNPGGLPIEAFDGIRNGVATDRAQFYRDLAGPFYGANRPGARVSQGIKDAFWQQSMMCGLRGAHACIKEFSETVFTEDLRRFAVPTLFIHGEDDQLVPINDTARLAVGLVPGAVLKVYPGAPHGLPVTHREAFNGDLLAFLRS